MALFINIETNEEHLFVPALDEDAAHLAADIESIIPISDEANPYEIVKKTISKMDGRVGIEGDFLQYNRFMELQNQFLLAQMIDIQPIQTWILLYMAWYLQLSQAYTSRMKLVSELKTSYISTSKEELRF